MLKKGWDDFTKAIPTLVVYGGIASLLLDDAISAFFGIQAFIPISVRISLIGAVLGSLVWILSQYLRKTNVSLQQLEGDRQRSAFILDSWENIDLQSRYKSAKCIKILNLAGTQFAMLGRQELLSSLFSMVPEKTVEILMGNPSGVGVKLRYDDKQGEPQTYDTGPLGIDRRLVDIYKRWKELPKKYQSRLIIKVYSQYPTVSLVRLDHDYYSATYGYLLRGGDCPKLHTIIGSSYSNFLERHFENVAADATTLAEYIQQTHPEEL